MGKLLFETRGCVLLYKGRIVQFVHLKAIQDKKGRVMVICEGKFSNKLYSYHGFMKKEQLIGFTEQLKKIVLHKAPKTKIIYHVKKDRILDYREIEDKKVTKNEKKKR